MSSGLGTEQRIILAIVTRDTNRNWTRADIQRASCGDGEAGKGPQISKGGIAGKNFDQWRANKDFSEINFTRSLSSLVKRGLLERHQLPGGPLTWKVTQIGIDEASRIEPTAANSAYKGSGSKQ